MTCRPRNTNISKLLSLYAFLLLLLLFRCLNHWSWGNNYYEIIKFCVYTYLPGRIYMTEAINGTKCYCKIANFASNHLSDRWTNDFCVIDKCLQKLQKCWHQRIEERQRVVEHVCRNNNTQTINKTISSLFNTQVKTMKDCKYHTK